MRLSERLGGQPTARGRVRVGTTSWADRTLVREGGFYPRRTMSARDRLAYYCSRFPVAEIATTYRFPPTPALSAQWAERSPDGFEFNVRGWSLLTGNPAMPDSLWPDLQSEVQPTVRDRRRLYSAHLSADGLTECFARFAHSLRPLAAAGRLGVVTLQYPTWFSPRPETWAELATIGDRLPGYRLAVELRSPKWFEGDASEATLEWLEQHHLALICVDGPPAGPRAVPRVVAATADRAIVRLVGRRCVDAEPWTAPYRYRDGELLEWKPAIEDLASSCSEVHLLFDNGWGRDPVDNALTLAGLVDPGSAVSQ